MKSEILVVTDGISKINKLALKEKLGDIKLNILKIGDEVAEPEYYDLEKNLKDENVDFDPSALNIKQIQNELKKAKNGEQSSDLSMRERRVYQLMQDISDSMFKDLKELADKYVEIKDLNARGVFDLSEEKLAYIQEAIARFEGTSLDDKDIDSKTRLYKQLNFLGQYVKMLQENSAVASATLAAYSKKIFSLKQKLLKDPELLFTFVKSHGLEDDKKLQKLAKKELKEAMKNLQMDQKSLTFKDMQKAQMLFTMHAGKGGTGQFFMLLIALLLKALKTMVLLPVRPFARRKKEQ